MGLYISPVIADLTAEDLQNPDLDQILANLGVEDSLGMAQAVQGEHTANAASNYDKIVQDAKAYSSIGGISDSKKEDEKKEREKEIERSNEIASFSGSIDYLADKLEEYEEKFDQSLDDIWDNLQRAQEINEQLQEQGYITIQDKNLNHRLVFEENGERFLILDGERVALTEEQQASLEGQDGKFASPEEIANNPLIAEHLNVTDAIKDNDAELEENRENIEETRQQLAAAKTGITDDNYQQEVMNRVEGGQISLEALRELTNDQDPNMIKKIEDYMAENNITTDFKEQIDQYAADGKLTFDELKTVTQGMNFAHGVLGDIDQYLAEQNITITGYEEKIEDLANNGTFSLNNYLDLITDVPPSVEQKMSDYKDRKGITYASEPEETTASTQDENDAPAPMPSIDQILIDDNPEALKNIIELMRAYPETPLENLAENSDLKYVQNIEILKQNIEKATENSENPIKFNNSLEQPEQPEQTVMATAPVASINNFDL